MRKLLHRLARNGTKFMAWLVELLQPMQSQLGPISFHFIEAKRHRYTTVIKSTPRLFKIELFSREEYAVISMLKSKLFTFLKKRLWNEHAWNLTWIVLFYVRVEYRYQYIHLFFFWISVDFEFQLNFQKSIRIWANLNNYVNCIM